MDFKVLELVGFLLYFFPSCWVWYWNLEVRKGRGSVVFKRKGTRKKRGIQRWPMVFSQWNLEAVLPHHLGKTCPWGLGLGNSLRILQIYHPCFMHRRFVCMLKVWMPKKWCDLGSLWQHMNFTNPRRLKFSKASLFIGSINSR